MTKQEIAIIERIVRQQCCGGPDHPEEEQFETWLGVDQKQFLELVEHIPDRISPYPLNDWWAKLHPCAAPDCVVSVGERETFCYEHSDKGARV